MSIAAKTQLSVLAASPGGINRMRALIARLAFQGALSTVTASEWKVVSLGSVVSFQNGYAFKSEWFSSGGVRLARNTNIGHGDLEWNDCAFLPENLAQEFSAFKLQAGDILLSLDRPIISTGLKVAVVKESDLPCLLLQRVAKLTPAPDSLDPDFLLHWLRSPLFVDVIDPGRSNGVPHISTKQVASQSIPLPSLAEQHRIVAKVDELMALCDRLEARQQDAEAAHARLVQALLDSLTQARDAQEFQAGWERLAGEFEAVFTTDSSVESLKATLVHLAISGRLVSALVPEQSAEALAARLENAKTRATAHQRKQKELTKSELPRPPFEAPSHWSWRHLDALLMISGGITLGRKSGDKKIVSRPYLRVANVQRGYLDLGQIKEIDLPEDEVEKYKLNQNDLLITEGGDWDKVGRTVIWRGEIEECLHQNHVFRARPCSEEFNVHWAELYLNAQPARDYFAGSAKQTTNLASINMTQLRSCPFPLPPLEEQERIIAKVSELLALCDQLKARIAAGRAKQAQLAEALVKQAVAAAG